MESCELDKRSDLHSIEAQNHFFFFFLQCWRTSSGFTQTPYSLNNDALKQTTLLNSVNCLIHANYYDLMGKTIFFIPTEYFLIVLTVSHALFQICFFSFLDFFKDDKFSFFICVHSCIYMHYHYQYVFERYHSFVCTMCLCFHQYLSLCRLLQLSWTCSQTLTSSKISWMQATNGKCLCTLCWRPPEWSISWECVRKQAFTLDTSRHVTQWILHLSCNLRWDINELLAEKKH